MTVASVWIQAVSGLEPHAPRPPDGPQICVQICLYSLGTDERLSRGTSLRSKERNSRRTTPDNLPRGGVLILLCLSVWIGTDHQIHEVEEEGGEDSGS